MDRRPYPIDAALAALADRDVETRWREARESDMQETVIVLARQLVLRALPMIEQTCRLRADRAGFSQEECERVTEEASINLLLRLLHDDSWANLGALAAAIAEACLNQTRCHHAALPALRPQLRLITAESVQQTRQQQQDRGNDHAY
jgi:hypothetical protein